MEDYKIKTKIIKNDDFFLGWTSIFCMLILCSVWIFYMFWEQDKKREIDLLHQEINFLEQQNVLLEFELSKYKFNFRGKHHD